MFKILNAVITGDQLLAHNVVMGKQTLRRILGYGSLFFIVALGSYIVLQTPTKTWKLAWVWYKASIYYNHKKSDKSQLTTTVSGTKPNGEVSQIPVPIAYKHPVYRKSYIDLWSIIWHGIRDVSIGVVFLFLLIILIYYKYGHKQKETKHIRGTTLATPAELKKALIKKAKLDQKKFGGCDA